MCLIECLKPFRTPHELGELWSVEYKLLEGGYLNRVKQRGIDPGHEDLQIFTDPFELKTSETWEGNACWWRQTSAFLVGARKGVSNPMLTYLRLAITAKPATIATGEMYPERGVLERVMWTRSVVDKRIFGSAGNGMASNSRSCSYTGTGADVEALKQGGRQTRHRGWGRPHGAGAGALTQHVWTLTQHAGPGM